VVPQAEQFKAQGNKALQEHNFEQAVELYGEAIALDPSNHVYFSNRAAAFANLKKYRESLTDANKTIELKPDWPKVSYTSETSPVYMLVFARVTLEKALRLFTWGAYGTHVQLTKRA